VKGEKPRNRGGFTGFERALIALATLLFAASCLIYASGVSVRSYLSGWEEGSGGAPLGRVKTSERDLRRRLKADNAFREVGADSPLYSRDTLITGPAIGATLELDDGTEIRMEPSTLIRLSFEANIGIDGIARRALIDVISGAASGTTTRKSARTVILRSGSKTVELSASRPVERLEAETPEPVLIAKIEEPPSPAPEPHPTPSESPAAMIAGVPPVIEPPATPPPPAKKSVAGLAATVEMLPVELDGKALNEGSYVGPFPKRAEVLFKWKPVPEAERYVLKIENRSKAGSSPVVLESRMNSAKWPVPATYSREWMYTVEAWPKSGNPVRSTAARLKLTFLGPVPRNPADRAEIPYRKPSGKLNDVIFTWPRWPIATGYVFEVASDAEMSKIVLTQERGEYQNFVTTTELQPGSYWWTVRAKAKDGSLSRSSKIRTVTIK
jgi:hypothetical protein